MPIRDTFWNIPHWAEIAQYVLAFLTVFVFVYGVLRRVRAWRSGQPEKRTDQLKTRLTSVIVHGLGQLRITQDIYAGIMHLAIFWGMAALFLGTILATVDWDVTHLFLNFQFLKGDIYVVYELVLDIFGLFVLAGLGMAAYRRYITRPERLKNAPGSRLSADDMYVIVMLLLIAVTGYLVEGLRIAVVNPDWAKWSPAGKLLASIFTAGGDPTNRDLHMVIWTTHTVIAFVFIASIPFTKLFHIFTTPTNIFFRSLKPAGELAPARPEPATGVKNWRDFTWKQILDFEACTRCGRCQDNCPAFASGSSLSPRNLMIQLEASLWQRGNGGNLFGEAVKADEIWACTSCRACVQVCPAFIDHLATIVDLRRYLVNEGEMDNLLQTSLSNLARYGNSFGQSDRLRARWAQPVQPKIKDARKEPVDYLWFVGDYASYHVNLTPITAKTAEVFHRAGLDFGILYEGERNAGNDLRRVGEEGLYEMLVDKNATALGKCTYNAIVTTDPHTYSTLKNEYTTKLDAPRPVLHYTELLAQLIAAGQLRMGKKLNHTVTYHDPCYLGRYNQIYDAPRRVIEATGCQIVEMPRNRDRALCCGAGGGRIWMEETGIKERASEARIREAALLPDVRVFVVACPKDATMFKDAVKTCGLEDRLVVKDIIELVDEATG